jgi:hypothetical protein
MKREVRGWEGRNREPEGWFYPTAYGVTLYLAAIRIAKYHVLPPDPGLHVRP